MDDLIEQCRQRLAALPGLPDAARTVAPAVPVSDLPIAQMIDHTLLKPEATPDQIDRLCAEAREYRFASVCVNPLFVDRCRENLAETPVAVCTVIGFPLGATTTKAKLFEAQQALGHGARELDMVIPIGLLRAGRYVDVLEDVRSLAVAAHAREALLKVIIETVLLDDEQKVLACLLAQRAGADYVKTSTGFAGGGATVADVALMRRVVGPVLGVKASGGVRNLADARAMIAAGATRIGASAGVAIVREAAG
jgi:deoxyribose-phosphate aldolase